MFALIFISLFDRFGCIFICAHLVILTYLQAILYISAAHQHHKALHFTPYVYNSLCCDDRYIYTIQYKPPLLSVYNWSATYLCDVDHKQLGLSGKNCLLAVSVVGDSIVLAVAYHSGGCVRSLVRYDIK